MKLTLTQRDTTILKALCRQVRLFGQRQLAETFWQDDIANTRRRMRGLADADLVVRQRVLAQPLPDLLSPVAVWRPDCRQPDSGKVAFRLQSRWRHRCLRSTVVYTPTSRTIDHFGGSHHQTLSAQVTHDLGVTAMWQWYFLYKPQLLQHWVGEDIVAADFQSESLPDAVLNAPNGEPALLLEFGGQYSRERIEAFHAMASSRQLPYQIW